MLQATHVINVLEQKRSQRAYESLAQRLSSLYRSSFRLSDLGKARKRYWYLTNKNHRHAAPFSTKLSLSVVVHHS